MPEREGIRALAAHQATMVIFLSVGQIRKLCEQLIPAYGEIAGSGGIQGHLAG